MQQTAKRDARQDTATHIQALRLRTTVITDGGERIKLDAVAPSRAAMDELVAKAYPDARFVSTIVVREAAHA